MGASARSMQSLTRDWNMAVIAALHLATSHVGPTGGLALCVSYTSVSHVQSDLALRWQRTVSRLSAEQAGQTGGLVALHTHVDLDWSWQRDVSRLAAAQSSQTGGLGAAHTQQEREELPCLSRPCLAACTSKDLPAPSPHSRSIEASYVKQMIPRVRLPKRCSRR